MNKFLFESISYLDTSFATYLILGFRYLVVVPILTPQAEHYDSSSVFFSNRIPKNKQHLILLIDTNKNTKIKKYVFRFEIEIA